MGRPRIKIRRRSREIRITRETKYALQEQVQRFREKFGREPGPKDPLFFDPYADSPVPIPLERLEREGEAAMLAAGFAPEQVYAFKRTGAVVSTDSPAELQLEWIEAIEEYRHLHKILPEEE